MKRIYILLTTISLSLLQACNSFFDQMPDDQLTLELVFQSKQYSEEFLANAYSYVKDEADRKGGVPFDPLSDDFDVPYSESPAYPLNIGNWNPSSGNYNFWHHYYRGIRQATYFILHIDENRELQGMAGGPQLIKQYKAEARFLRAFFYFNLLRQYGPVIIIGDEIIASDLDGDDPKMNLPRTPYDACVDYIVSELDLAAADLPVHFTAQSERDYGRATKVACMAVKSRMLLYATSAQFNGNTEYSEVTNPDGTPLFNVQYDATKWERAANAAKDLIDLDILGLYKVAGEDGNIDPYLSYRDLFLAPWNSEVLFARKGSDLGWPYEKHTAPRPIGGWPSYSLTQQLVDEYETASGKRIDEPGTDYVENGFSQADGRYTEAGTYMMYVNREPRFYVTVLYNGAYFPSRVNGPQRMEFFKTGSSGRDGARDYPHTGYIVGKNISPNSDVRNSQFIARPYVLYRYAEVLLSYVEALNESSPGHPDVTKYLNMIRERAGLPAVPDGLGQSEMRERIRHERRIELAVENLRWSDTRRWKIAEQTDGGEFWGMNTGAGTSLHDPAYYQRTVFERRVFRKEYYLFPIPQSEVDRNSNIVQNPGW